MTEIPQNIYPLEGGMCEVDILDYIVAKVDVSFKFFDKLNIINVTPNVPPYEICGVISHVVVECQTT